MGEPIIGRIGFITGRTRALKTSCKRLRPFRIRYPDIRVVLAGKVHPQY
ncbi:MAG: hypothetical protein Q9P14_14170 [candidate division KSB1 bacterium]|nr:hypothetical protein [candidate division KSB1 bacterium]